MYNFFFFFEAFIPVFNFLTRGIFSWTLSQSRLAVMTSCSRSDRISRVLMVHSRFTWTLLVYVYGATIPGDLDK